MDIPVFLLMQYKSGSLYFLHKLLNETAYLRSMKSPRVGITAFFVCATVWNRSPSERKREPVNRLPVWGKKLQGKGRGGEKEPVEKHLQIDLRPLFRPLSCRTSVSKIVICQSISLVSNSREN